MARTAAGTPLIGGSDYSNSFSAIYGVLATVHLGFGILFLAFPLQAGHAFFNLREGEKYEHLSSLLRLFSALFFGGATIAWALKGAAGNNTITNSEGQRLKATLIFLAPLIIALHLVYIKQLTWWGLILGALAMGTTMLIPLITLGMSDVSFLGPGNMIAGVTSGCRTFFDSKSFTSIAGFLFSLCTLLFFVAGLSYVFLPKMTLKLVFGYWAGPIASFMWKCIGIALIFALPAVTYILTDATNNGFLDEAVPMTLNAGLLVLSIVHLAILIPVMIAQGVTWLNVLIVATWALALLASIVGLTVAHNGSTSRATGYTTL